MYNETSVEGSNTHRNSNTSTRNDALFRRSCVQWEILLFSIPSGFSPSLEHKKAQLPEKKKLPTSVLAIPKLCSTAQLLVLDSGARRIIPHTW